LSASLLSLNEGRRAVLLSDGDPLSSKTPIVGVWLSGGKAESNKTEENVGNSNGESRSGHGRGGAPNTAPGVINSGTRHHPYLYPACLRFLLSSEARLRAVRAAGVPPSTFLVLHLPDAEEGVDAADAMGKRMPLLYEASQYSDRYYGGSSGSNSSVGFGTEESSSQTSSAVKTKFMLLDFSADVVVGETKSVARPGMRSGGKVKAGLR
ncbi:unnamed protein product, partial [Choristocarpus tenellus]